MTGRRSPSQKRYLKAIGTNIRKLRKEKSLSQEALAAKSGLDRTYVGSVERGERNISLLNLRKIAEVLEVRASDLLDVSIK